MLSLACTPVSPPLTGSAPVAQPTSATPDKVQLGALSSASDSGLWIAVAKRYFEQEHIEIETTTFASAAEMVAPLGAGQIDVGGGAPGVGLDAAALRGIEIKIVADKAMTSPGGGYQGIVVRKDLYDSGQVTGPADLKGRKFAIPSTTGITPEVMTDHYMKRAGLGARDMDLIGMAFPDMIPAFANKAIDAGVLIEPFLTRVVEGGDGVLLGRADVIYPNQQVAVILYSSDFAKKTDLGVRFMAAYLRGVRDFNDAFVKQDAAKRAEVIDILAEYTTIKDKPLYDKVVMPRLDPNGKVNVDSLKADQEYYIAAQLQEKPADIDRMVDMSFAEAAVRRLGPYTP
jgi:NitT/TauT family transport system substrate-binding protein